MKVKGESFKWLMQNLFSLDNEWAVSTRVERIAKTLLSAFPTTPAQDAELLRTETLNGVPLSQNSLNAIRYRMYYKDILYSARRNIMERWLSLLTWQPQAPQATPQ